MIEQFQKNKLLFLFIFILFIGISAAIYLFGLNTQTPTTTNNASIFSIENGKVFYNGGISGPTALEGADADSFVVLGGIYGKDKNRVYSCQVECKVVENANVSSFEVIDNSTYAKDKIAVYKNGERLDHIDRASFKVLNINYYADRAGIYMNGVKIAQADPDSFQVVDDLYATDKSAVYYQGEQMAGADPATFRVLENMYTKDAFHVYFDGKAVANADPKTFVVIEGTTAQDKSYTYENGTITQSLEDEMISAFSKKYNKPTSDINIEITENVGGFAKGNIRFEGEMGGAIWFAAKTANGWELAADGQGPMNCDIANKYSFPVNLVPACINTQDNNALIQR